YECPRAAGALGLSLGQQREVGELRPDEERRRAVRAGRDAGAAPDARRRVERALRGLTLDGDRAGSGRAADAHRYIAAGSHDAVERAPIHDEIAHHRLSVTMSSWSRRRPTIPLPAARAVRSLVSP